MAGVPVVFRKSSEGNLINYDWVDLADGTGYVTLQGFSTTLSGSLVSYLFNRSTDIFSTPLETAKTATYTNLYFDMSTFNSPRIMRGKAILTFSEAYNVASAGLLHFRFEFDKVDKDGNVTTFAKVQAPSLNVGAGNTKQANTLYVDIPQTIFKRGDYFELHVIVENNSTSNTWYLGHDPQNRAGSLLTPVTTYPTKFQLFLPFKIDL